MRSVRHLDLPPECARELEERRQALLTCCPYDPVVDSAWNSLYNTDIRAELLRTLEEQHGYRCVYCDTPGSAHTIEHYLPKKQFPYHTLDWLNLSLACGTCQMYKREPLEFRGVWPLILDPMHERVEDYVYISPEDGFIFPALHLEPRQLEFVRVNTTIKKLRLNELGRPRLRLNAALDLRDAFERYAENPSGVTQAGVLRMLEHTRPWSAVAWQIMTNPENEYIPLVAFYLERNPLPQRGAY